MAIHAIATVKRVLFRGFQQEFANVYHYDGGTLNATDASNLAATIKAMEVDLHSGDVTFVRWAVWTAGGTPGTNQMIAQGNFSGVGLQATNTSMDRERAVLVMWDAGTDVRGRLVTLKKWYHCCGAAAGNNFTAAQLQQTDVLSGGQQSAIATKAQSIAALTIGANNLQLCGPKGRVRTGSARVHRYLEHHQLGDQWR